MISSLAEHGKGPGDTWEVFLYVLDQHNYYVNNYIPN